MSENCSADHVLRARLKRDFQKIRSFINVCMITEADNHSLAMKCNCRKKTRKETRVADLPLL